MRRKPQIIRKQQINQRHKQAVSHPAPDPGVSPGSIIINFFQIQYILTSFNFSGFWLHFLAVAAAVACIELFDFRAAVPRHFYLSL